MILDPAEAEEFYSAWWPLLVWTNHRKQLVPPLQTSPPRVDPDSAVKLRDVIFADDTLLEQFVAENPAKLPAATLDLVRSWRYRRPDEYYVWKHHRKHTVFLNDRREGFAVLGLISPLAQVLPMAPPLRVKAVLLPFRDRIVCISS